MNEKFCAASYTITKAIKHRYNGIIFWRVMICEIRLKNRMWNQIYNKYKMHFWWFRYNFRGVNSPDQLLARNYLSQFKGQHQNKHRKACCILMEPSWWETVRCLLSDAQCGFLLSPSVRQEGTKNEWQESQYKQTFTFQRRREHWMQLNLAFLESRQPRMRYSSLICRCKENKLI